METYEQLKAQEERVKKLTEEYKVFKEQEDRKLKAEWDKLATEKKTFSDSCAKDLAGIDQKKAEAEDILSRANSRKVAIQSERDKLTADQITFNNKALESKDECDRMTAAISNDRADLRTKETQAQAICDNATRLTGELKTQEGKTAEIIKKADESISATEKKMDELKAATDTSKAELQAILNDIEAAKKDNQAILDKITADRMALEIEKGANQILLDDANAAKDKAAKDKQDAADMLNRNYDEDMKLREREKKIKAAEEKLKL